MKFPQLTPGRAVALMVLVTLMWSSAGVVTRHLESAQRFEVTFWRSFFTVVSLLLILPVFQGRAVFSTIRAGGRAFWMSGACWSVMFTAFMLALMLTSVANVLVVMALGPLMTALLAWLFIGQRVPLRTALTIVLAGAGMAWMYRGQADFPASLRASWWPCWCHWLARLTGSWHSTAALTARISTWCLPCWPVRAFLRW